MQINKNKQTKTNKQNQFDLLHERLTQSDLTKSYIFGLAIKSLEELFRPDCYNPHYSQSNEVKRNNVA